MNKKFYELWVNIIADMLSNMSLQNFPECFAFYPEKFCKFSRTLFRKCLYPQLLNSSINFTKLLFSMYLCLNVTENIDKI